jgi:hypothetical protein
MARMVRPPRTPESLLEAFYHLFVGEHNLDIDLLGPHTFLEDFYQLTHTKTSFGVVLASQPTRFADLSLAQKFSATIEAVGWPADTFATILHSHNPTEVVTQTTEDGKTALHWAAAHIGEWLIRFKPMHGSPYFSRRTESYEQLASDLIRMGANVHALWDEKIVWSSGTRSLRYYDPFLSLFKGFDIRSRHYWDRSGMAQAVSLWGKVLAEGGVDLHEYIVTENKFLKSIEWSDIDIPYSNGRLAPVKLFLKSDSTLAVTIREITCVTVWKAQATRVPGAWPASPLIVDTIVWLPGAMDESYGFEWAPSDTIEVNTKPGLNQIDAPDMSSGSDELLDDSIIEAGRGPWDTTASQDDHGPVAIVLGREMRFRQRVSWRHSDRRAQSTPPVQDPSAKLGADRTNRAVRMPSGWRFTLHKCPLDSRWHKRSVHYDFSWYWRDCMHGRCHELPGYPDEKNDAASFEGWFLRNEDHVDVAKRYAQQFCLEQMHIVEATLERAIDRARLAMGPKRPEDARMS